MVLMRMLKLKSRRVAWAKFNIGIETEKLHKVYASLSEFNLQAEVIVIKMEE